MADAAPRGDRGGFGSRGGDRGRGRGRGRRRGGPKNEEKEWMPVTRLGVRSIGRSRLLEEG